MSLTSPIQTEQALVILGSDQPKVLDLAGRLEKIAARIAGIEVTNDTEAALVNDLLGGAKFAHDDLEKKRVKKKAPHLQKGREVDELFTASTAAFKTLEKIAKEKLSRFLQEKNAREAALLESSEEQRQLAGKAQLDAILQMANAQTDEERAAAEAQMDAATTGVLTTRKKTVDFTTGIKSNYATTSQRYTPTVTITDITKIPRKYLEAACDLKCLSRDLITVLRRGEKIEGAVYSEEPVLYTRPTIN